MEQPTETLGPTTAAPAARGTTPSVRHPCAAGPGSLHTAHKPGYLPISSTAPWVVRVPQAAPQPDTNWPMSRAFPFGLGDLSRIQLLLSLRVPATKSGHADLGKAAKAMGLSRTQGRDKVCFDRIGVGFPTRVRDFLNQVGVLVTPKLVVPRVLFTFRRTSWDRSGRDRYGKAPSHAW